MPSGRRSRLDDGALMAAAERALESAYARYSGFQVGAAALTARGNLYLGCNVENVAYPLGLCAERSAVAAAVVAEGADCRILRLAVTARHHGQPAPCTPCGACRQFILERGPEAVILFRGDGLALRERGIRELLPLAFGFAAPRGDAPD